MICTYLLCSKTHVSIAGPCNAVGREGVRDMAESEEESDFASAESEQVCTYVSHYPQTQLV